MRKKQTSYFWVKILCISILCFLAYQKCSAQNPPQKIHADYQFLGVGGDSVVRLPKRRGTFNLDSGAIMYNGPDSTLYTWTGHQWIKARSAAVTQGFQSVLSVDPVLTATNTVTVPSTHPLRFITGQMGGDHLFTGAPLSTALSSFDVHLATPFQVTRSFSNPTTDTSSHYAHFFETMNGQFVNPDDNFPDYVWQFGINNAGNGSRVNTSLAGMWQSMEQHFIPFPGGPGNMEFHNPEIVFKDGFSQRGQTWTIGESSAHEIGLKFHAGSYNFDTNEGDVDLMTFNNLGNLSFTGDSASGGSQFTLSDNSTVAPSDLNIQVHPAGIIFQGNREIFFNTITQFIATSINDQETANNSSALIMGGTTPNTKAAVKEQFTADAGLENYMTNLSDNAGGYSRLNVQSSGSNTTELITMQNLGSGNSFSVGSDNAGSAFLYTQDGVHGASVFLQAKNNGMPLVYTHTVFTPSTGGSINAVTANNNIINTGTLAALTIVFPASPVDGDKVMVTVKGAITSVSYSGGTVNGPTSFLANGQHLYEYVQSANQWF